MEDFEIQDESGDRKYFTIIPNYILNHSTLYDRELYVQMKRMAGEKGTCYASRTTLSKQCGMSPRKVDSSLKYLIAHEWVRKIGTKTLQTKGGPQSVGEYAIADLWKKNVEFYEEKKKGVAPNALPYKQRGSTGIAKGVAPGAHKEEPIQEEHTSELRSRGIEIVSSLEREYKEKNPAKYPHAREVFAWFPHPQPSWQINTTELKHAELLFARGKKNVRGALAFVADHDGEDYMPQITKPSDLERKWLDLRVYYNKS